MKKLLLALCLPLACSAQADESLSSLQAKLTATIRQQLAKHDLRKNGAYNPFQVPANVGLVRVYDDSLFSGEGGGQNGAFAEIDSESSTITVEYTNTWIHAISETYCTKAAVEMRQYRKDEAGVPVIRKGMENQCIELATTSRDLALSYLFGNDVELVEKSAGAVDDQVTPQYRAVLKNKNGKLSIKMENGRFAQSVYIWNRTSVSDVDKRNKLMDDLLNGKIASVASKDQGVLSTKDLLSAIRDVEWVAYGIPSLSLDVKKARAKTSLLSLELRRDGEFVLDQIEKYQKAEATMMARKDELYKNESQAVAEQQALCKKLKAAAVSFDESVKCSDELRRLLRIQDEKQRSDSTFAALADEQQSIFKPADETIDRLIKNADRDPSIISFLIAIQPK